MTDDTETLIAGLRRWTREHDAHVRAAVELLIAVGGWLRRQDFRQAAVEYRYRLSIMGTAHSRAIADAVAAAVGVGRIERSG